MRRTIALPIGVCAVILTGVVGPRLIGRRSNASPRMSSVVPLAGERRDMIAAPAAPAAVVAAQFATDEVVASRSLVAWAGQKLIRSADLRIQVKDAALAARQARDAARVHGGLAAESHVTQTDGAPTDARIVLRIPADSFDATIEDVRHLGRVRSENGSTGDVTREYVDLETRLVVKQQTVEQLRGLLANRTGNLSDVLQVERELARVVTELEQMKAQRREYDREVAVSSITISLFEPASEGLASLRLSVVDSLRQMTDVLAASIGTVVYLLTFLAPWVILAAAGWWCVRAVRRAY